MEQETVEYKSIDLKNLNKQQKEVIRHVNNQIIEFQTMFDIQPEELVISKLDYKKLVGTEDIDKDYKYLLLGKIKIYHV